MQMSYAELSVLLRDSVGLEHPPVALAFVDRQPDGVSVVSERVPSSCSFWRAAEERVFYAPAAAHNACAVGAHVMGFRLSEETSAELMASIKLMAEVEYLPETEVPSIPQVAKSGAGIVYGPLADFTLIPSAVVLWVNPGQAMMLEEALKTTSWKHDREDWQKLFGRPACGAIARAVNSQNSAFSLGCVGMRTFTGIPAALSLLVIPNAALSTLAADLRQIVQANDQMLDHYKAKMTAFA